MSSSSSKPSIGVDLSSVRDLAQSLDAAVHAGFEFASVPLFHPRHRREGVSATPRETPATRSDLVLDSSRWTTSLVGKLSPWLQLDAEDARLRRESERVLRQELQWASHLGVPAVLAPPPPLCAPSDYAALGAAACLPASNYAAHLAQTLEAASGLHVWVRVALTAAVAEGEDSAGAAVAAREGSSSSAAVSPAIAAVSPASAAAPSTSAALPLASRSRADPWEAWNALRQHTECHPRLSVALELTADMPSAAHVARWAGEPIKAAILPTSLFLTNKGGFPTLTRGHQQLVGFLCAYRVQFLLTGRARVSGGYSAYLQYLHHISEKMAPWFEPSYGVPSATPASQYCARASADASAAAAAAAGAAGAEEPGASGARAGLAAPPPRLLERDDWQALSGYLDVMQAPLQPLADNLESQTYETFERDPVKYEQYEAAIAAALRQRPAGEVTVVWVVGAGRGPLVKRALAAADAVRRSVRVFAVEKNPNAIITLQNMRQREPTWAERVTIVSSDMRALTTAASPSAGQLRVEPAGIIVSELLGSFGDNELSPECLDGCMRFLSPSGVSIPSAYTSFLAPVTSHRLWNEARGFGTATREETKWLETAFVVRMWRFHHLGEPQPAFTFAHPSPHTAGEADANRRYVRLRWTMPAGGAPAHLLHGFGGYFDATLFDGGAGGRGEPPVHISTEPRSHTPGMFSWFPLFFPLRQPVYVAPGDVIELHMWRCTNASRVWYEWALASPLCSPVHNPAGRSYAIGL